MKSLEFMLSVRAFVCAAVVSVSSFNGCFGQTDALPKWTRSTTTKVKPEMRQEFEGCLRQLISAHKKAGTLWFLTLETFAGDTTEYTTVVPVMNFGDLDGPPVVMRVFGEAAWERLGRKIARCYTAQRCQYATPQTDIEINHAGSPAGIYWVETRTLVVSGKIGEYLNWLRSDYRPALEAAGVARFHVSQPIFGAVAGEILTMRMLENLSEIDRGAVVSRALTDDQARALAAKAAPLVSSSSNRILRMRADLTYPPGK